MSVVVRVEGPDAQNTVLHSCSSLTRCSCPSLCMDKASLVQTVQKMSGGAAVAVRPAFSWATRALCWSSCVRQGSGADAGSFSQVSGLRWLHQLVAGLAHAFWFLRVWTNTCVNASPKQQQQPQQQQASISSVPLSFVSPVEMDPSWQPSRSAAQRWKGRRLRAARRHEQQSIAQTLAVFTHHCTLRGPKKARAGEEECEVHYTAEVRKTPPPQPVLFKLFDEKPGGGAARGFR